MRQSALTTISASVVLLCLGCTPSWEKWYRERERIPHAYIVITEQSTGCEVSGARIEIEGLDSTLETNDYGWRRLDGVMGKSFGVKISHERFAPLDTLLQFSNSLCDTIHLQMNRISVDSSLDAPVSCAYRSGWEDAERSIQTDDAYIFEVGGLRTTFLNVDEETGLPLRGNFSCMIDDHIVAFAQGHNDKIQTWIAQHGLPPNSKRKWLDLIKNPQARFDSLQLIGETTSLYSDSLKLISPDSTFEVSLLTASRKPVHDATLRFTQVLNGHTQFEHISGEKKFSSVEVAWGPMGSELVIIRTPRSWYVFNTQLVELLNLEWD